jgi:4-hydroxyacetophenone monooxygenase
VSELPPAHGPSAAEADFRDAVAIANIPTLLMVLVQLTGDRRWLRDPYRPTRPRGLGDNDDGGLPPRVQAEIREAALAAILAWRSGRPPAMPAPSHDLLIEMLSVAMGERVPPEYAPMMAAELGLDQEEPGTQPAAETTPPGFGVVIIGAGVSGLCAAVKLQEAGIPYTIIERNATVGGTWLENRYPGCGVDTPNHLYSFSFAKHDWSYYFANRTELHDYLEHVATESDLRRHIQFETDVIAARYDDKRQAWSVTTRTLEGHQQTLTANVLISAVGAFNNPKMPGIKGLETFAGPCVHTARWPDDLDLAGRRVAVVGNGASAMQLVPAIADTAESLTVFQRSPQWAAPFEKFQTPVPDAVRFLIREVPLYQAWYRLRLAWTFNDKLHPTLQKDPDWPHPDRSLNLVNDRHREFFTQYIESQIGDRKDLLEAVVPRYPPFGKRILLDNNWYRTLTRDDVELVTEPIREVRPEGVVTTSGTTHEADVLVCATGFDVVRFLSSFEVRGRSGRSLRQVWNDDDARAYLGTTVPGFPNFFIMYGPNLQTGHGGSLMFLAEIQARYIVDLVTKMLARGIGAVECKPEVHDAYNVRVDAAHGRMVWTHPGMETYYRNSRGRVVVNNPFRVIDYWHEARSANLEDYLTEKAHGLVTATSNRSGTQGP